MKLLLSLFIFIIIGCTEQTNPLIGSWKPKKYLLKDGESKPVDGHIFFSKDQWSVVFFILDENGKPINGSAEGGTYELDGNNNLTFTHHYNMSDVSKGTPTDQSKVIYAAGEIEKETCSIEIEDDILVIYFPSGNAMIFIRV